MGALSLLGRSVGYDKLENVSVADAGHGFNRFGLSRRHLALGVWLGGALYRFYFRVTSEGSANIPSAGGAIVVANHSGTLPIDAAMLAIDLVRRTRRAPRPITDHFVSALPLGVILQRMGAVGGSADNVRELLLGGELVEIFPEGVPGISKPFAERYRLQDWRVGHAELALRHRVPIVPAAIIGAEEQWPVLWNSKRVGRWFGLPHLPIPLTPLPLPVHYHIYYGAPIAPGGGDADDPAAVQAHAATSRDAVERLIERGRAARRGVFA